MPDQKDAVQIERARFRKICLDKLALAGRALASQEGAPFPDNAYSAAVVMAQDVVRDILRQIEPEPPYRLSDRKERPMHKLTNAEREFLEQIETMGGAGLEARPGTHLYDAAAGNLGAQGLILHRRIDRAYRLFLTEAGYARLRAELLAEHRRSELAVVPAALAKQEGTDGE